MEVLPLFTSTVGIYCEKDTIVKNIHPQKKFSTKAQLLGNKLSQFM